MAVSQKQIAERVGVSIALVSRVLSGKAAEIGIAPDTINRVLKAAEDMDYVPSAAALSLKGKPTRTIGIVVYDFNDPFFGALIQEIQAQAQEHSYSLVLVGFLNRIPAEQDLQALHKHAIDGLIIIGSDTDAHWLDRFDRLPASRIGHGPADENSVRVTVDEPGAARQLVEHLARSGRKRPSIICGPHTVHRLRRDAFEQIFIEEGLSPIVIVSGEKDPYAAGRQAALDLLQANILPDAFVCGTDQIAIGTLHALYEAGIDVPDQIAVTGFDDIPAAAQFNPSITTIRQPLKEMVHHAFASIINAENPHEILFSGCLISRETA